MGNFEGRRQWSPPLSLTQACRGASCYICYSSLADFASLIAASLNALAQFLLLVSIDLGTVNTQKKTACQNSNQKKSYETQKIAKNALRTWVILIIFILIFFRFQFPRFLTNFPLSYLDETLHACLDRASPREHSLRFLNFDPGASLEGGKGGGLVK